MPRARAICRTADPTPPDAEDAQGGLHHGRVACRLLEGQSPGHPGPGRQHGELGVRVGAFTEHPVADPVHHPRRVQADPGGQCVRTPEGVRTQNIESSAGGRCCGRQTRPGRSALKYITGTFHLRHDDGSVTTTSYGDPGDWNGDGVTTQGTVHT